MARVSRKPTGVRRSAAARSRSQKARAAKKHTSGMLDRAMSTLPFTEEQWHKFFLVAILAFGMIIVWNVAKYAGLPELAQAELAKSASRAGFEVERVRVTGVERLNEQVVYERVLGEQDRPMPLVDVEDIRERLMELSWVKDARVSRQLPDLLHIDIVEREPHAVVVKPDRLILVDATGHELEPIAPEDAGEMLRISGPGAQKQVAELDRLLDAAPALTPQVAAAEWIGNRRWNLTFKTDQLLLLPSEDQGPAALVKFAEMDGRNRLIGGKAIAIDMRVPDRVFLRCANGPCPRGTQAMAETE